MKRLVIQTKIFSEILDGLIRKKQLLLKDYEELEKSLAEHPKQGDVIPGLSGLRKIRLKSSYSGKRGGFRVDYLDIPKAEVLYLIVVYPKNLKEDLSSEEKREIKALVELLKNEVKI
jgi:mRNA-degrading endonuclease RelE of RelBE toxin-antitoxin system